MGRIEMHGRICLHWKRREWFGIRHVGGHEIHWGKRVFSGPLEDDAQGGVKFYRINEASMGV